jgi:hypothetical protein
MNAGPGSDLVIATSIPPKITRHDAGRDIGEAYQQHCMQSWLDAGFRVLSLNAASEIPQLKRRYPRVEFIALSRDARALCGRPTPLLSDVLEVLRAQPQRIVGITNADIYVNVKADWRGLLAASARHAFVVAQRADIDAKPPFNPQLYPFGYDAFFFEREAIPQNSEAPFAMGVPWWDYWLPLAFRFRGHETRLLTGAAFHLRHPTNYEQTLWRHMAEELADFIVATAGTPGTVAAGLDAVVDCAKQLAAARSSDQDEPRTSRKRFGALDERNDPLRHELSRACVAAISSVARPSSS